MTAKKRTPRPKTRNPLYRGATPEQVGRALLRHSPRKRPNGRSRNAPVERVAFSQVYNSRSSS